MFIGTFTDVLAIFIGSVIGLFLGSRLPQKIKQIIFHSIGLVAIGFGVQMAFKSTNILILIASISIGGIIGETLSLEKRINDILLHVNSFFKLGKDNFVEGFVTSSLLFCVGSMGIIGPINEVQKNDHSILFAKSMIDGFISIAIASSLGVGAVFSAVSVLVYQGSITIFASIFHNVLSDHVVGELTAVGGLLIVAISFELLEVKKLRVTNFLPAMVVAFILTLFFK